MKRKILFGIGITLLVVIVWAGVIYLATAVVKSRVPVSLGPSLSIHGGIGEFASAKGTWVIEGQKQAFPLQTTEIKCYARLRHCFSATAEVAGGDQLTVNLDSFEITEWTKSHVVFVDDSPLCVRYTYTINWAAKSATGIRHKRATPKVDSSLCLYITDQELRLSLRGGFEVWNPLQEKAVPWFGRIAVAPLKLLFQ